jgi:outer membrane receptor protein involved in Fe transport
MVSTPGTQTENFVPVQTVNTNALPVGATRRVEVLRDGAGAIYGSDAVAGVVNVVLDDTFDGLRLDARHGFADGTSESTVAFKAGTKIRQNTQVMLFGSYTHRTPLFASERDFAASEDHRPRTVGTPFEGDTAFDNRSTSSPFGAFSVIPTSVVVRQGTSTANSTALTASGVFHVERRRIPRRAARAPPITATSAFAAAASPAPLRACCATTRTLIARSAASSTATICSGR